MQREGRRETAFFVHGLGGLCGFRGGADTFVKLVERCRLSPYSIKDGLVNGAEPV